MSETTLHIPPHIEQLLFDLKNVLDEILEELQSREER